jgi:alpha-tubulin suppressor-like RCC1 family protein
MWGSGTYPASVPNPNKTVPNLIPDLSSVRSITAARSGITGTVSFALQTTGTVLAWGANQSGNLGDGTTTERRSPVQLAGLTDIREVVALNPESGPNLYNSSLLALRADGTVFAWGGPVFGRTIRQLSAIVGTAAIPGKIRHIWASGKEFVLFAEDGRLFKLAEGSTVLEPLSAASFQ